MQEYNPQIYHYLHIVHNPWKIAKPEDVDKVLPNEYVQHSIGMISRRIEGAWVHATSLVFCLLLT